MFLLIFYRENFLKFFTENLIEDVFYRKLVSNAFSENLSKRFFKRKLFENVLHQEERRVVPIYIP